MWVYIQCGCGWVTQSVTLLTIKLLILEPHNHLFLILQLLKTDATDSLRGIFKTRDELDSYEKMWHCLVYQPSWDELKVKVTICNAQARNIVFIFTNDTFPLSLLSILSCGRTNYLLS